MINDNKEKILIYMAIAIIAFIFIIVVFLIWNPMFKKINNNELNSYDVSLTYEKSMKEYYKKYLEENLKITKFNELYNKIDKQYISRILGEDSKEKLKNYLVDNNFISMNIDIQEIDLITNDNENIFRVSYITHNVKKYVNIIEKNIYDFTISFDQDELKYLLSAKKANIDDVIYTFNVINSDDNSIRYNVTIENNSINEYEYNFSNLNSLQAIVNNGTFVNMALVSNSSNDNYMIPSKSSRSVEVLFNINFKDQVNITGFKFNNVKFKGDNISIEI